MTLLRDPAQIFGFDTHPSAEVPSDARKLMTQCLMRLHSDKGDLPLIEHCKKHDVTVSIVAEVSSQLRERGKRLEATFEGTGLETKYSGDDLRTAYKNSGLEAAYNEMREQYRTTHDHPAHSVWNSIVSTNWPDLVRRPFPRNRELRTRIDAITLPGAVFDCNEMNQILRLLDEQQDAEMLEAVRNANNYCMRQENYLKLYREESMKWEEEMDSYREKSRELEEDLQEWKKFADDACRSIVVLEDANTELHSKLKAKEEAFKLLEEQNARLQEFVDQIADRAHSFQSKRLLDPGAARSERSPLPSNRHDDHTSGSPVESEKRGDGTNGGVDLGDMDVITLSTSKEDSPPSRATKRKRSSRRQ